MSDLKMQLLTASVDSLVLAGFAGFLAGINIFGQNYLVAGVLLVVALLNVKQASTRYDLYNEQKN